MKERVFKLIDSIKDMIYSQKYPVNEYLMIIHRYSGDFR